MTPTRTTTGTPCRLQHRLPTSRVPRAVIAAAHLSCGCVPYAAVPALMH
jgi:hypothetical protein